MTRDEFTNQRLNAWEPEPRDIRLAEFADRYHAETEAYDRTVCTGPVKMGQKLPSTPYESGLISRNAREVMDRIAHEAAAEGFERKELWKAIVRRAR